MRSGEVEVSSKWGVCVCGWVRHPSPSYIEAWPGRLGGNIPLIHPRTASPHLWVNRHSRVGQGGRGQGAAVPLAHRRGLASASCCGLLSGPMPRCWCGLAQVCSLVGLFPFFDNCAFSSGAFFILSTCIWCKFLHSDNSSSISGI
jgi:hypothetical protein